MVGFARNRFDTYITLDAGGGELQNPTESVLGSMNNGGTPDGSVIVGLYVDPPDSSGQYHGYVVHHGTFHPYDVAGSVATQIWGINAGADFVGLYDDANGNEHGFLQRWGAATPITIDAPADRRSTRLSPMPSPSTTGARLSASTSMQREISTATWQCRRDTTNRVGILHGLSQEEERIMTKAGLKRLTTGASNAQRRGPPDKQRA